MVNANEAQHVAQHLRALGLGEVRNSRILHRGAYLLVQPGPPAPSSTCC
jgi:hypothetical protein